MSDLISAWVDEDEMRRLAESLLSRPYGYEFNRLEIDFGSQFEGFAREVEPERPSQAEAQSEDPVHEAVPGGGPTPQPIPEEPTQEQMGQPSPSVMRSAVQFLKKAQAEGRAGGVIRGVRATQGPESLPLAADQPLNASSPSPPVPEPRPIHSPFRRVSEVEPPEAGGEERPLAVVAALPEGRLKRPPAPSGDDPILSRVIQFGKWLKGPVGARNFFVSNSEGKILIDELANSKLIQVARSLAGVSGSGTTAGAELGSLHVRIGEDSILEVVPTPSQFGTLILGLVVEHPLPEELIHEVRLGLEEVANARLIRNPQS